MSTLLTTNLKNPSSGSNNIVLDSSGNVGIGTSSPISGVTGESLTSVGVVATQGYLTAHQTSVGVLEFNGNTTALRSYGATAGTGVITFNTGGGGGSADTERFRINSDGSMSAVIPGGSTLYPASMCRAWVNFNGTSTVAIRASYNVSSITDNGTGDYTVNFTTAMADANYHVNISTQTDPANGPDAPSLHYNRTINALSAPTASAFRVSTMGVNGTAYDRGYVCCAIFR